MNSIKLSLLTVLLVFISFTMVGAKNSDRKSLNKQVREYVKYPDFGYETKFEGKVMLVFSIINENQIKVENVIGGSSELKQYLINSLEGKLINVDNQQIKDNYVLSFEFVFAN